MTVSLLVFGSLFVVVVDGMVVVVVVGGGGILAEKRAGPFGITYLEKDHAKRNNAGETCQSSLRERARFKAVDARRSGERPDCVRNTWQGRTTR